ncbi:site-2 protease family protein [Candidatus Woesearchaeota archaeon]|nr:site-2 protease family protein [Candidatus Woesearchaeota archaeon]
MDIQIILAVLFVIFLTVFLLINRQKVVLQKIIHPILYMVMFKSKFGIKFINKFADKYREQVKFFGYCCIGFGFLGMIYITINVLYLLFMIFSAPSAPAGVAFVLPFTNIPGVGYLSFLHWIVAIFVLALVHEFSHGIVAKAHGLEIKSSGFAFLCLFVPIIPAAFVEPDEKKMKKHSDVVQYSIFAAGPMMNIFLAVLILIAMPYVLNPSALAPFEDKITEPIGFSFDIVNESLPAAQAGLKNGMIVSAVNGNAVKDAQQFAENMYYCAAPGDIVNLTADGKTYSIKTEDRDGKALIGINNIKNERRVLSEYEKIKHPYYWLKELFRWLFLLNLFIGLFNLLPLGIVDGGLMLGTLLKSTSKNEHRARKIWAVISTTLLLILLLSLFATYFGNPFSFLFK